MDSTVRSRPNHYETLGLEPTATGAEIEQAFTTELRRPRAFGGVAHLSIAYETLRDPAKRRAYDASLGIKPEPQPQPAVGHWLTARAVAAPVRVRRAPADPPKRPADPLPPPAPQVKVEAEPKPAAEPRLPSFLAASLREPAKREPRHDIAAPARRQPEPPRRPHVELKPGGDRLARYADEAGPIGAEDASLPWKRTAIGVVGLVAAVALFGAWAGWEAGNDIEAQLPERAVKVVLPPAKARAASTAAPAAPAPFAEHARPERPRRPALVEAPIDRPAPPVTGPEQQPSEFARAAQSPGLDTAIEAFAADAPAPAPVPASLGLPNRVVARTIERIGYSCGQVASTTAVDGASGIFKVTCTSGSSYQARPVGGRYRFRRWGRQ